VRTNANLLPWVGVQPAAQCGTLMQLRRPQLPIAGTASPLTPSVLVPPRLTAMDALDASPTCRAIPARTTPVVHAACFFFSDLFNSSCAVGSAANAGRSTQTGVELRASWVQETHRLTLMQRSRHSETNAIGKV
jgi:hypothetical protein